MYIFSFVPSYSPRGNYEVWFSQEGKNILLLFCLVLHSTLSSSFLFVDLLKPDHLLYLGFLNIIYWNYLMWCFSITQVNEHSIFQASEKYCIRMPNKWNFSFDYFSAAIVVLGIYVPGMSSTSFSPLICALTNTPFVYLIIFCMAS